MDGDSFLLAGLSLRGTEFWEQMEPLKVHQPNCKNDRGEDESDDQHHFGLRVVDVFETPLGASVLSVEQVDSGDRDEDPNDWILYHEVNYLFFGKQSRLSSDLKFGVWSMKSRKRAELSSLNDRSLMG